MQLIHSIVVNVIFARDLLVTSYSFGRIGFHNVSVYPKKDVPFFIIFTAVLCSLTAILAFLTHIYPEQMGFFSSQVSIWRFIRYLYPSFLFSNLDQAFIFCL